MASQPVPLLLVLALIPFVSSGPVAAEPEPSASFHWSAPHPATGTTAFNWYSGADVAGPGAFRAVLDVGQDNECHIRAEVMGDEVSGPSVFLHVGGLADWVSGYHLAQVHAEDPDVDTRQELEGPTGIAYNATVEVSGLLPFTIMARDLYGGLAPWGPARIEVACANPLTVVSLSGSREVASFDQASLDGTGASVFAGFGAYAGVAMGFEKTFASERVEVHMWTSAAATTPHAYEWTLRAPNQTHHEEGIAVNAESLFFVDGPGTYGFELSGAGGGILPEVGAWLTGFEPVEDLDDILA